MTAIYQVFATSGVVGASESDLYRKSRKLAVTAILAKNTSAESKTSDELPLLIGALCRQLISCCDLPIDDFEQVAEIVRPKNRSYFCFPSCDCALYTPILEELAIVSDQHPIV